VKKDKSEDTDANYSGEVASDNPPVAKVKPLKRNLQRAKKNPSDDTDSNYSDELAPAARATPSEKNLNRAKKDPDAEVAASKEIDRLLKEATEEFVAKYGSTIGISHEIDPKKTLAAAKKKMGSPVLLDLLLDKQCSQCSHPKLGMVFYRDYGYMSRPCEKLDCYCISC
jgi:hypothetical protein